VASSFGIGGAGVPSLTPYFAQVLVEGKATARAAVLNRPGYLNALTTTMVRPHFLALVRSFVLVVIGRLFVRRDALHSCVVMGFGLTAH
jgi:hypothetical protein